MKILIIHYRYSILAGPERYMFNIEKLLKEKGHSVIPFSLKYEDNLPSTYSEYFPKPYINDFHIHKANVNIIQKINYSINFIYNRLVFLKLSKLIEETNPDIAYVLKYNGKLTYAVLKACYKNRIPIVHRISDYTQFCAIGTFLKDNSICEKCLIKPFSVVKQRCVHNSFSKSFISFIAKEIEKKSGYLNHIKAVICPSDFTANYFKNNYLFRNSIIRVIPTFYNFVNNSVHKLSIIENRKNKNIITYFGRVSEDKGVIILVEAMKILQLNGTECRLNIIGFRDDDYSKIIKDYISINKINNILCFDFLDNNALEEILNNSFLTIIPSMWYDNMPNSLIESMSMGIPVIATRIGSLAELIIEDETGYLFERGNSQDLADKIKIFIAMNLQNYINLSHNSFNWAREYCSKDNHYSSLIECFNNVIQQNNHNK